jgi:uncharacterized protein YraI
MDRALIENLLANSLMLEAKVNEPSSYHEIEPTQLSATISESGRLEGCVTVGSLRVRNGPSTDYSVVAGLSDGECRVFDARNSSSTWLRLAIEDGAENSERLWVFAEYIDLKGNIYELTVAEK